MTLEKEADPQGPQRPSCACLEGTFCYFWQTCSSLFTEEATEAHGEGTVPWLHDELVAEQMQPLPLICGMQKSRPLPV